MAFEQAQGTDRPLLRGTSYPPKTRVRPPPNLVIYLQFTHCSLPISPDFILTTSLGHMVILISQMRELRSELHDVIRGSKCYKQIPNPSLLIESSTLSAITFYLSVLIN